MKGQNLIQRDVAQLVARLVWDQDVAGSNPVIPTKFGFGKQFPKPFLFSPTQILRADEVNRQPSLYIIIPTNWNLISSFLLLCC